MALNAFATESCRRAPPTTTVKPQPSPGCNRRRGRELRRQRHDHLVHARMVAERGDAALQDRTSADFEQLLRHAGAKPEAGAAGSDDGSDVHVS